MQEFNQSLQIDRSAFFGITLVETTATKRKGLLGFLFNKGLETTQHYELKGPVFGKVNRRELDSFYATWQKLVMYPTQFSYNNETSVDSIMVNEESKFHEDSMLRSVISKELDLSYNAIELDKKIKTCRKIFHEDFPGNYILELEGKRLGIFELVICESKSGIYNLKYFFKNSIKSFS